MGGGSRQELGRNSHVPLKDSRRFKEKEVLSGQRDGCDCEFRD